MLNTFQEKKVGRIGMRSLSLTWQDVSACLDSRHACVCARDLSYWTLIDCQRLIQPLYNRRGTATVSNTGVLFGPAAYFRFPIPDFRELEASLPSDPISDLHPQTNV